MSDAELAEEKRLGHERVSASEIKATASGDGTTPSIMVALAWTAVGIPLAWGVYRALIVVGKFFN